MIPDEAVEAAAKAVFENVEVIQTRGYAEVIARLALEAALPYLTERAYNAGHLDGMTGAPNTNPYQSQTDWPDIPRRLK